jgi:integral membrane sensor domain MASE1
MDASLKAGSPARYAAYISLVLGVGMLVLGTTIVLGISSGQPMPLGIAFLVLGIIEGVTGWFALQAVRVGWAFGCSINGTLALVMLFGAPKVRDAADVFIGVALIPSFVLAVVTLLYALGSEDY